MIKKILGIEKLEKENDLLIGYAKEMDKIIENIYTAASHYKKENNTVAHIGFEKILNQAADGLDLSAETKIDLANIE